MDSILVVAPHPDDETLGCGGSIALDARAGARVTVLFLTSGELGIPGMEPALARATREREAEASASVLGLARLEFARLPDYAVEADLAAASAAIDRILREEQPTSIYVPHEGEAHPDHAAAAKALRLATRHAQPRIALGYEVWSPVGRVYSARDISASMRTKLQAIRKHESQLDTYALDHAIRGLNRFRGVTVMRRPYAEAFAAVPLGEGGEAASRELVSRFV